MKRIIQFSIVLTITVFFASVTFSDEVTAYKQGWFDGYRKAYRDAFLDFINNMQEYSEILNAVLDYKKLLTDMGINAYPSYVYSIKKLQDGNIEIERKVIIKPVSENIGQAEFLKRYYEEALKRTRIKTGFWVYIQTSGLAREDIGMFEFIAEEKGLHPVRFGEILVLSIEDRKAQAEKIASLLNSYGIYPEVRYVTVK